MAANNPFDAVQQDLQRLSEASASLMKTLAKVRPSLPPGVAELSSSRGTISNLVSDLQASQRKIDLEIAQVSAVFTRFMKADKPVGFHKRIADIIVRANQEGISE